MSQETFQWVIAGGVALAALCTVIMAGTTVVIYKVLSKLLADAEDVSARVGPVIDTVRQLGKDNATRFSDIAFNVREITAHARDISEVAKDQAHRFAEVGKDIADRAKVQVARVDAAMDETVDQVQHAGNNIRAAALKPVREASGVIAGVRAAVSTLAQGRRTSVDHITQDEEMFI
jgi:methyl-accepting chemotaxis protein